MSCICYRGTTLCTSTRLSPTLGWSSARNCALSCASHAMIRSPRRTSMRSQMASPILSLSRRSFAAPRRRRPLHSPIVSNAPRSPLSSSPTSRRSHATLTRSPSRPSPRRHPWSRLWTSLPPPPHLTDLPTSVTRPSASLASSVCRRLLIGQRIDPKVRSSSAGTPFGSATSSPSICRRARRMLPRRRRLSIAASLVSLCRWVGIGRLASPSISLMNRRSPPFTVVLPPSDVQYDAQWRREAVQRFTGVTLAMRATRRRRHPRHRPWRSLRTEESKINHSLSMLTVRQKSPAIMRIYTRLMVEYPPSI
mmetsp:Transcript_12518/g.25141  ORF Transcript_12518/g.25141 Transcript_12518/m.25141 type:complete len:308 (+) Transcript_12518:58-981(+)